jgi:hypothetical protein
MWQRKSKTQFVNQEHNTQNAITLLNYLKHIAPQQLMLRTQILKHNFLNKKVSTYVNSNFRRIQTQISRLLRT